MRLISFGVYQMNANLHRYRHFHYSDFPPHSSCRSFGENLLALWNFQSGIFPPPTNHNVFNPRRPCNLQKMCNAAAVFFFFCFFIQSRSIWSDCFRIPPLSSQITICNSHRWRDANLWWINYLINHRVCRFCWFLQNKNIYGWRKKVIALFSKIAIYSAKMKGIRFFSRNKNLSLHFFLYQLFWGTIRYVSHND